jgi:hypothetical protein
VGGNSVALVGGVGVVVVWRNVVHVVVGGVLFVEVYDGDRFVRKEGVGAFVEHFRRVPPPPLRLALACASIASWRRYASDPSCECGQGRFDHRVKPWRPRRGVTGRALTSSAAIPVR